MKEILAQAKSIEDLLSKRTYQIDYYQREYRWEQKQVDEMVDDLVTAFLDSYRPGDPTTKVSSYGNYFLGSIIVSKRGNDYFIVDGQQRLTSLTLLLIHLHHLIKDKAGAPQLDALIYYDDFGVKTFNLKVEEREPALHQLLDGIIPDQSYTSESVANMVERYSDIDNRFPYRPANQEPENGDREITDDSIVHFVWWVIRKVFLVEITATSDEDAYTIFETMNDRGLSLTPTDMLKGYLLANISDEPGRMKANDVWRRVVASLHEDDREASADFFKSWLRSQYAANIRSGSVGKVQDFDFDRIGSEFHRWVRDKADYLGLEHSHDFAHFTETLMPFFAEQYQLIGAASATTQPQLEHVRYNASRGFTLQPMLLMAPVRLGDSRELVVKKMRLVAMYLDILLARREWNYRRIGQSTMRMAIFNDMKSYRDCTDPDELAKRLFELLQEPEEDFDSNDRWNLTGQNGITIKRALARITEYVEQASGGKLDYDTMMLDRNKYEIEHIWANFFRDHRDEFAHETDFREYRNRIGGLLLLPKSFNASYGGKKYGVKYHHYFGQNALAKSLHENAYTHHPDFSRFIEKTGLPFRPHAEFKKEDLDSRQNLYREIAKQIWNPQHLLDEVSA